MQNKDENRGRSSVVEYPPKVDKSPERQNGRSSAKPPLNGKSPERGRSRSPQANRSYKDRSDEDEMQKMMGFAGFGSTKNKKVKGTDVSAAHKVKPVSYRQYMNREKGFNRPLSPPPNDKKKKKSN